VRNWSTKQRNSPSIFIIESMCFSWVNNICHLHPTHQPVSQRSCSKLSGNLW
jgi:hypothetical protein